MSDERIWKEIGDLQKGQAAMAEAVKGMAKSVDALTGEVRANMEREHEARIAHEVKIAENKKDVDAVAGKVRALGEKLKDHEEAHRWWAAYIVAGAGVAVAVVQLYFSRPKEEHHGRSGPYAVSATEQPRPSR